MFARVATLVVAFLTAASDAPTEGAVPSPTATPQACSDGSASRAAFSYADVFGHEIDDPRLLRFYQRLAAMDGRRQAAVIASVKRLGSVVSDVPADYEADCRTELTFRTMRALGTIESLWRVDTRDATFDLMARRVELAVAAPDRDTDLAPFGLTAADLEPERSAPTACANPAINAKLRVAKQPSYPETARLSRTTGTVTLRVSLDPDGLVRSVKLLKDEIHGPSEEALVDEATFSAALSSYDAEISACRPIAGSYVFRADFAGR